MAVQAFSGLSSGVDTASIVTQLVALERQKLQRPQFKQRAIEAQSTGLKDVQAKLNALKGAAQALRSASLWGDTQTVETSDATKLSATRTANAAPGAYTIEVTKLATAGQQTYAYQPPDSADTITVGSKTIDLAAGATLADAVTAINKEADAPVYATAVDGKLVLSARATGSGSNYTATSSTLTLDPAKTRTGVDAEYKIDGVAQTSSSSNTVESALPGLKLTFKALGSSTVNVGQAGVDQKAVTEKVKAFVEAYNGLVSGVKLKMEEKGVANPSTATEAARGRLFADRGLGAMMTRLRTAVSDTVDGNAAAMDELRELGLSTGSTTAAVSADAVAGKLQLDEKKLTDALTADPSGVRRLLGGVTGVDGFAQKLEKLIEAEVDSEGVIPSRLKANDADLKRVKDEQVAMERRISAKEKYLKAQFAAMERAMSQSNAQSGWLSAQLASLG